MDLNGVKAFHGHWCPGLALGIRVSQAALRTLGPHAQDEEMVAIVEADNCAVDAVQYLTGCTFGKGNLIHLDYGKNAFTFIRRSDGKAIRVVVRPSGWGREDEDDHEASGSEATPGPASTGGPARADRAQWILQAPLDRLLDIQDVKTKIPRRARIHESVTCADCREEVMETRARLFRGATLCIPCFQRHDRQL